MIFSLFYVGIFALSSECVLIWILTAFNHVYCMIRHHWVFLYTLNHPEFPPVIKIFLYDIIFIFFVSRAGKTGYDSYSVINKIVKMSYHAIKLTCLFICFICNNYEFSFMIPTYLRQYMSIYYNTILLIAIIVIHYMGREKM